MINKLILTIARRSDCITNHLAATLGFDQRISIQRLQRAFDRPFPGGSAKTLRASRCEGTYWRRGSPDRAALAPGSSVLYLIIRTPPFAINVVRY